MSSVVRAREPYCDDTHARTRASRHLFRTHAMLNGKSTVRNVRRLNWTKIRLLFLFIWYRIVSVREFHNSEYRFCVQIYISVVYVRKCKFGARCLLSANRFIYLLFPNK